MRSVVLDPRGTAKSAALNFPSFAPYAREWLAAYSNAQEDAFLASELVRWMPVAEPLQRQAMEALIFMLRRAVRQGSTRILLGDGQETCLQERLAELTLSTELKSAIQLLAKELLNLNERGSALAPETTKPWASIVGVPGEVKPVIVHHGYLYEQRLWELEQRVANQLSARISQSFDHTLQTSSQNLSESEKAIHYASQLPLTLITGGPGTGKTTIIGALLKRLLAHGVEIEKIALCAPTGRAADRILESLRAEPFNTTALRAQTLHRLLSYSAETGRFLHHDANPLPYDCIVVDESSMLDLALFERLLRALPASAKLVLLGDANQLSPIDPGAVFAEMCSIKSFPTVHLTHSFRMNAAEPQGQTLLAHATSVLEGTAPILPALSRDDLQVHTQQPLLTTTGMRLCESSQVSISSFLEYWHAQHLQNYPMLLPPKDSLAAVTDEEWQPVFDAMLATRLLCVTREGPRGTEAINDWFQSQSAQSSPRNLRVEPVIVHKNDYDRELFNGDQGILVHWFETPARVFFRHGKATRSYDFATLSHLIEPGYAVTVHKAQGSEAQHVALLLPHKDLILLTRSLIYTAVTRARSSVIIYGAQEIFKRAIQRNALSSSGLHEKLAHQKGK